MSNPILGVHHISLKPEGYDAFRKTTAFYRDLLGMPVVRIWGEGDRSGMMLSAGNALMEITANGTTPCPGGSIRHFALSVGDVPSIVETVRAAGYRITVEPKRSALPANPASEVTVAFCVGPCGEEIEFFNERNLLKENEA